MNDSDFIIEGGVLRQYIGSQRTVSIPSGITAIAKHAFNGNETLTEITIPDGITEIGVAAFSNCDRLTCVVIPKSVRTIGKNAFWGCSALTELVLPEGIERIGSMAFRHCPSLKSIAVPASLAEFGTCAFYEFSNFSQCTFLTDDRERTKKALDMFNGKSLAAAFMGGEMQVSPVAEREILRYIISKPIRTALFTDFINEGNEAMTASLLSRVRTLAVDEIDGYIEKATKASVRTLLIDYKNEHYSAEKLDRMEQIQMEKELGFRPKKLADYRKLFSVSKHGDGYQVSEYKGKDSNLLIPGQIEGKSVSVRSYAFYRCMVAETVVMESGVSEIGDRAFCYCYHLKSVVIPEGVTHIGKHAFFGCSKLTELVIPDSVISIGESAFGGCKELRSIRFGSGLKHISRDAFRGCENLEELVFSEGLTSVGKYAFCECTGLKKLTLSHSITEIGEHAFASCKKLETVSIPKGLREIGDFAFSGCTALTELDFPETVIKIGKCAFFNCRSLMRVNLGDNTSVDEDAFDACERLADPSGLLT